MSDNSIERLLPRSDWSIYRLVRMASRRALELSEGKPALIKVDTDKVTSIALEEIAEGKVESVEAAKKREEQVKAAAKEKK